LLTTPCMPWFIIYCDRGIGPSLSTGTSGFASAAGAVHTRRSFPACRINERLCPEFESVALSYILVLGHKGTQPRELRDDSCIRPNRSVALAVCACWCSSFFSSSSTLARLFSGTVLDAHRPWPNLWKLRSRALELAPLRWMWPHTLLCMC
jgi:hypothetical protein